MVDVSYGWPPQYKVKVSTPINRSWLKRTYSNTLGMSMAATVHSLNMTFWPIFSFARPNLSISDLIQPIVLGLGMQCLCLWLCLALVSNSNCHPVEFRYFGFDFSFFSDVSKLAFQISLPYTQIHTLVLMKPLYNAIPYIFPPPLMWIFQRFMNDTKLKKA